MRIGHFNWIAMQLLFYRYAFQLVFLFAICMLASCVSVLFFCILTYLYAYNYLNSFFCWIIVFVIGCYSGCQFISLVTACSYSAERGCPSFYHIWSPEWNRRNKEAPCCVLFEGLLSGSFVLGCFIATFYLN